jgi:hypothetical protein
MVFISNKTNDLDFVDIGYALSAKIQDCVNSSNIALEAEDALYKILRASVHHNDTIGDYIAITNWGILFEESLSFNIADMFASLSQTRVLIAHNTGRIICDTFFLDYPNKQYSFNLNDILYYNIEN